MEAGRVGLEGGNGGEGMSFAVLQTFLRVLGHMLRNLNGNYFFLAQTLEVGAGGWGPGLGVKLKARRLSHNEYCQH